MKGPILYHMHDIRQGAQLLQASVSPSVNKDNNNEALCRGQVRQHSRWPGNEPTCPGRQTPGLWSLWGRCKPLPPSHPLVLHSCPPHCRQPEPPYLRIIPSSSRYRHTTPPQLFLVTSSLPSPISEALRLSSVPHTSPTACPPMFVQSGDSGSQHDSSSWSSFTCPPLRS